MHEAPVNILLVDDQPGKLLTYEAILRELGENLVKASSAREALDFLLRNEIAVALIDVQMPGLDGFDLAAMIREHPRYERTALIFVSAMHIADVDRLRGYEVGAVDYVSVPIVPEILRAKVAAFADLYRKTRQLEALNRELEQRVSERTAALHIAAAELRANEERLNLALDSAGAASWHWDAAADRLDWTLRFRELYGLTDQDPPTLESMVARVHRNDRRRLVARIQHMLETPGDDQWNEVFRIVHPRRGRRDISGLGRAFRDDTGRVVHMVGIDIDVTERVRSEQAINDAERRKDEFLATLSHELRNPLMPILTAVQLLDQPWMSSERRSEAQAILGRQTRRMVQLVDDVLDVSRITSGKIRLQRERIQLGDVVARARECCAPELAGRHIWVEMIATNENLWINGDFERLVQVVVNLLSNAGKFTEPLGRIEIRTVRDGDEAVLSVRDTGIGIEEAMLPRVFELFTRVSNPGYGTAGGLGVGLAIVRELVAMHGGTVHATSEGRGKGSEFVVRLPLC